MGLTVLQTYTEDDYTIEVCLDQSGCVESPREWSNLGTIWTVGGRRHALGDRQFSSAEELQEALPKHAVILPVYMYSHSGVSLSTREFSDPWDSGQIGVIFVELSKLRKECKRSMKLSERIEYAKRALASEIKTYGAYINGDVYGYRVLDENGDEIDSCWGFIGEADYCMEEGKQSATHSLKKRREKYEFAAVGGL